jgi:hypothetical protein
VGEFWVLGEELGHALLQLGDLSELAELRLVFVKVGIEGLGLVDKLGLLCQAVDDRLEEDASIWESQ